MTTRHFYLGILANYLFGHSHGEVFWSILVPLHRRWKEPHTDS